MKRLCGILVGLVLCLLLGFIPAGNGADKKFSLVVSNGFGSTRVGDLNSTLSAVGSVYDELKAAYPENMTGGIRPIPTRFQNWEAEFRWAFWRRFSIGISVADPTRYYGVSSFTITYSSGASVTIPYESAIKVSAPIKLHLHYSLPVFFGFKLVASAGIGRYRARMTQTHEWQWHYADGSYDLELRSFDVRGKTTGYHCGLALEYKINDRLVLLAESQWQFAKIRSLDGSTVLASYEYDALGNLVSSGSDSWGGSLCHYIGEDDITGLLIEKLIVPQWYPWDGIDSPTDERKAFLDLHRFTFRIGLKIGLF